MIEAAGGKRQAGVGEQVVVRLLVATWAEAVALARLGPRITGMGRRTYDLSGCQGVLSAGFAGACQAHLRPGQVLLAGQATPELRTHLGAVPGAIRTVDRIASPAEKAALGRDGVAAVDMETSWLETAAAAAGLPFLSVRVIIDRLTDRAVSLATASNYVLASRALRTSVAAVLKCWP